MPDQSSAEPHPLPVRDGSRDGPAPPPPYTRHCPVCCAPVTSTRARYCSDACKQRAFRLRHGSPAADLTTLAVELARQSKHVAHTIYQCPLCAERSLGERRCQDCHRFCRAVGLGGACPECDQLILIAELLGTEVTTSR